MEAPGADGGASTEDLLLAPKEEEVDGTLGFDRLWPVRESCQSGGSCRARFGAGTVVSFVYELGRLFCNDELAKDGDPLEDEEGETPERASCIAFNRISEGVSFFSICLSIGFG